jgi:diguanylate cyclase (GGDEF)-like protein/PAS domain S-box-containing protein
MHKLIFDDLLNQVSDAVIVSQEATGIIVDCNDQACRSLGYTRDELLRLTIFDIASTITPGQAWESEREIFARDGYRQVETHHRRRDGSLFPVEINARLIQKDNERFIVAVARDLTARDFAESRLRLQDAALNSTANAIVITDKDGIIEWANPAFTCMTGFAIEETLGKRPKELVKSGMQTREFYEILWNTILSGNVWRGEVVNKRKDGTFYTEEMTITPVYAENKTITHFIAVKQDISARKAAELKVEQSELTYRGILNSITEAVYILSAEGIFLDVNHGAELMYGYTREELIGKSPEFVSATSKNDLNAVRDSIQRALAGTPQSFEFWGKRKNGEAFPKSVSLVRGEYFGQQVVIAVARDITEPRHAKQQLIEAEQTYRGILNSAYETVCILDEQRRFLDLNLAAQEAYGYSKEECLGRTPEFLFASGINDFSCVATYFQAAAQGVPQRFDFWFVNKAGKRSIREVSVSKGLYFGSSAFIVVTRDITERNEAEAKLREAAAVMLNTHEGVMITDADANLIAVNPAFTNVTGYTAAEVLGKNPRLLSSGRQDKAFYRALWNDINEHGFWQGELWNRRKNGEIYPQLLTISPIFDDKGKPIRYLGVFADITQLKEQQAKLEFMAHHDPLTKLPNRALAESRLEQELEQAHRHSQQLSVLFIDLDRFKQVNDSFGHLMGDELLCAVSDRLNARLREGDILGRLGGDEFILIASPLQEKQDAAIIARDFINALSEPFALSNGVEVFIGGSIGISLFPDDGTSVADLTKNADAAMYLAKENGRNQFSFYTSALNADARKKLELENDLRRAVLQNDLQIHFQPKVDIRTGSICGAEALARWPKPDGTWVSPYQFIPLAEKSGVILTIGNWVLERTCLQMRAWLDAGLPEVCVALNVSARQFRSGHLDKLVAAALLKFKIPPHCLELELTESMLMHEPDRAIATMSKLKKVGVKLSLDDFGTGYSNFGYLRRFPIDSLKIDQSFVHGVTTRAEDAMIVDSIIGLAQRMKLRVVGEGVETNEQLVYLSTRGCDELQGFLFSKALPADDFAALLKSGKKLER